MAKASMNPVSAPEGRLVSNWWGRAWVENLEFYADEDGRISRGRTYLREGNVLDLKIYRGKVTGIVAGSHKTPYKVDVRIEPVSEQVAHDVQSRCSVKLSDAEQLMEGRMPLSMEDAMRLPGGLFPDRSDISFTCTCPDTAVMCKHVAATLLGVGVRFDTDPSLFFELRGISMDLFTERTMKSRLDVMLDNADVRTDRMLDDSLIGSLFGVVEHMEHERRPIEMDALVRMLGRPLYEEGLALAEFVSEPADIGDGMMKVTVSEPKVAKQNVVIWRDRDGNPKKYGCGCDSDGICRHISASLVRIFCQDAREYEIRKGREYVRISARIADLDSWEDGSETIDEALDICDDILETFGFDDLSTVHLMDDLFDVVNMEDESELYPKVSVLSDLVRSLSPEDMAGMLENDWKSWLFIFSSEIPRKTLEAIYSMGPGSIGTENWNEVLFLLGRYDEYIGKDTGDCERILRCIYSASNCGREDDASRMAGMLALTDVPSEKTKEVESVLKSFGIGNMALAVAKWDFINKPSVKALKALEALCRIPPDVLIRRCWDEIVSRRRPSASELRFFAENGCMDAVGEYLSSDDSWAFFRMKRDYDELGWLFNIFLDNSDYANAASLGRRLVENMMVMPSMYPMASQLLKRMDGDSGFENLPQPHSKYMADLRRASKGRRRFWEIYDH